MKALTNIPSHESCFTCGQYNKQGLKLKFDYVDGKALCRILLDNRFQSYEGIIHGGILAAIADSTMINLVCKEFGECPLTCKLDLRYKSSVRVGDTITIEASLSKSKCRMVWAECMIVCGDSTCVEGEGVFRI